MAAYDNLSIPTLKADGDYKLKLSYFNIEGAAEKVRLVFHLSNIDWEDCRVNFADWPALKSKVPNGQLPILEVTDKESGKVVTITQSPAMCRCAGIFSKNGCPLVPSDPIKNLQMEVMMNLLDDDSRAFSPGLYMGMNPTTYGYPKDYQFTDEGKAKILELRNKYMTEDFGKYQQHLSDALASGPYLCGDAMTLADIFWLVRVRYLQSGVADGIPKNCIDAFPAVKEWYARMMADEGIAGWYKEHPNKNLGEE